MSILGVSFNQFVSHLTVGTEFGYMIYTLDGFNRQVYRDKEGGVKIAKMLRKSNICFLVGGGDNPFSSNSTITMWDEKAEEIPMEIDMQRGIKNLFVCRDYIIVVTLSKIYVMNYEGSKLMDHHTYNNNEFGVCAVALDNKDPNNTPNLVATLGKKKGSILVWSTHNNGEEKEIQAHNTNIVALAISSNGNYVASASETGTIIKIWDTRNGNLVTEFRRGALSAIIHSLAFSPDCSYLACCSGNGSVHIFWFFAEISESQQASSNFAGVGEYLSDWFKAPRAPVIVPINKTVYATCAFDDTKQLHVATQGGHYYKISGKEFGEVTHKIISTGVENQIMPAEE